jgi:pimeloyl-ACP methyl ester carboxylesterase
MDSNESCVAFSNSEGLTLRGVLHSNGLTKELNTSIICLNTGLNDMVGWHRIQVKTARKLSADGYSVLRYDDTGIGDSDGDIDKESIVEIFSDIETGMFVQNAIAAVNFMTKTFPKNKIVLLGFCGGGLTAMHCAANSEKIDGVIDIGGPVTLSSNEYLQKKDPWEVHKNIEKYRSKVFRLRPWINFLTFRGEYGVVFKSIKNFIRHKMRGEYDAKPLRPDLADVKNLNRQFFLSFEKYAKRGRPCLFFYAEHDSATWEFKKYFLAHYSASREWIDSKFEFYEAKGANHILSTEESQKMLYEHILTFLDAV